MIVLISVFVSFSTSLHPFHLQNMRVGAQLVWIKLCKRHYSVAKDKDACDKLAACHVCLVNSFFRCSILPYLDPVAYSRFMRHVMFSSKTEKKR